MYSLQNCTSARNSAVASIAVVTTISGGTDHAHENWTRQAAADNTDWPGIVSTAIAMMTRGGIIAADQDTETVWDAPSWRKAAAEYHRGRWGRLTVEIEPKRLERLRPLMADSISLERVYNEIGRDRATPAVTVEALKLAVRVHGPKTLAEPTNQERLRRCDAYARDRLDLWMTDFKKGNCL